jgi:hypothetical protein
LKDKTKKPDYREDLAWETKKRSSPKNLHKFRAEQKTKQRHVQAFKAATYIWDRYRVSPTWSLRKFATVNNLEVGKPETELIFRRARAEARKDLKAITDAIRYARVRCNHLGDRVEVRLDFKTRPLSCVISAFEIERSLLLPARSWA